jgi:hypothetical protein
MYYRTEDVTTAGRNKAAVRTFQASSDFGSRWHCVLRTIRIKVGDAEYLDYMQPLKFRVYQ